jgi:hypothetical protein
VAVVRCRGCCIRVSREICNKALAVDCGCGNWTARSTQKRCVLTDCLPVSCGGTFHGRVLGLTVDFRFSDALDELLSLKEKKRSFGEKELINSVLVLPFQ